MNKFKRMLGLCECKGCYKRSICEVNVKGTKAEKEVTIHCEKLCNKHMLELINAVGKEEVEE